MFKKGNMLILYILHKEGKCMPDECPFCDEPKLESEFDREFEEDIRMGNY